MDDMTKFTPFKREDHVYHNEAFAELCKDAVRAFNGTPVCELPPPRFTGSGVYAIYCTARKGIYERYGNKVNRMGYNVPIYVGKAVPKGDADGEAMSFDMLSCQEQLEFWHKTSNYTNKDNERTPIYCNFIGIRHRSTAQKSFVGAIRSIKLSYLRKTITIMFVDFKENFEAGAVQVR